VPRVSPSQVPSPVCCYNCYCRRCCRAGLRHPFIIIGGITIGIVESGCFIMYVATGISEPGSVNGVIARGITEPVSSPLWSQHRAGVVANAITTGAELVHVTESSTGCIPKLSGVTSCIMLVSPNRAWSPY